MKIRIKVSKEDRKMLARELGAAMGLKSKYLFAPTYAFKIGEMILDKDAVLETDEEDGVTEMLTELGYGFTVEEAQAEDEDVTGAAEDPEVSEESSAVKEPELPDEQPGDDEENETDEALPDEQEASEELTDLTQVTSQDDCHITIEMPRDFFTDTSLENLQKLIDSKAKLMKKAFGAKELPVVITDEKVSFPWFTAGSPDETRAYMDFISRLSARAKETKRVVAREREVESEKFAMRCFLLTLGFKGAGFKTDRAVLLRNLEGHAAFPTHAAAELFAVKQREKKAATAEAAEDCITNDRNNGEAYESNAGEEEEV